MQEGGVTIRREFDRWVFTKRDGQPCQPWATDENLTRQLDFARRRVQPAQHDRLAEVNSFHHPDASTIRPRWAGEPFDLHACVHALFTIKLPERQTEELDQQAA